MALVSVEKAKVSFQTDTLKFRVTLTLKALQSFSTALMDDFINYPNICSVHLRYNSGATTGIDKPYYQAFYNKYLGRIFTKTTNDVFEVFAELDYNYFAQFSDVIKDRFTNDKNYLFVTFQNGIGNFQSIGTTDPVYTTSSNYPDKLYTASFLTPIINQFKTSQMILKDDLINLASSIFNCSPESVFMETRRHILQNTGVNNLQLIDGSNRKQLIWIVQGYISVSVAGTTYTVRALDSLNSDIEVYSLPTGATGGFTFSDICADKLSMDGTFKGHIVYYRFYCNS